jgi:hypothetical protein
VRISFGLCGSVSEVSYFWFGSETEYGRSASGKKNLGGHGGTFLEFRAPVEGLFEEGGGKLPEYFFVISSVGRVSDTLFLFYYYSGLEV